MTKEIDLPPMGFEETGRTKEVTVDAELPGTKNRKVFARGPISRHITHQGKAWPLYDWLMLMDGRWYNFHRVANMEELGVVDLSQVQRGNEVIIWPGLIYRLGAANTAELARWRAAQDKIEAKLAGRFKGTENAATNSKLIRGS